MSNSALRSLALLALKPERHKMKHGSLFSGIGGFDLAAQWVGWENIFQCEIDNYCQKLLKQHFPNVNRYRDIREFDGTKYRGTVDVISGGFPCQPFSVAGNQRGQEDNRYLWPEMLRVISEIKPAYVVGENVFGIISISLDQVLSDLEAIGYTTETFIVPACAVNAPHRRDRVWIIGYTEHAGFNGPENGKGSNQRSNGNTKRQNEICEPTRPTLSRNDVANTHNGFSEQPEEEIQTGRNAIDNIYGNAAYTNSNGQQRPGKLGGRLHTEQSEERKINRTKHEDKFERNWFEVASELCRVDDGIPNRFDRIKGLGNAIVPQVAYEIFKAIDNLSNDTEL